MSVHNVLFLRNVCNDNPDLLFFIRVSSGEGYQNM